MDWQSESQLNWCEIIGKYKHTEGAHYFVLIIPALVSCSDSALSVLCCTLYTQPT